MQETTVNQRRPHRKSRNGCIQCKRRKIKCDELKPICSHCKRLSSECSFLPQSHMPVYQNASKSTAGTPSVINSHGGSKTSDPGTPLPFSDAPLHSGSPAPEFGVTQMELMHHYTSVTYLSICRSPQRRVPWQITIPQLAFKDKFLLHGLLAISALHMAYLEPDRREMLNREAFKQYDLALSGFRESLANVSPENCHACFAFSSLLAIYSWASPVGTRRLWFSHTGDSVQSTIDDNGGSVEWVLLVRGIHTLLKTIWPWVQAGPLKPMLKLWLREDIPAPIASTEDRAKLTEMSQIWKSTDCDLPTEEIEALEEGLEKLLELFGLVFGDGDELSAISCAFSWPIMVPETYIQMVNRHQPEALVVLAHFSLILNVVDDVWYMRGMSRHLLQTIHAILGEKWEKWIAWPLQDLTLSEFKRNNHKDILSQNIKTPTA